jgi:hypothetical protein
MQRRVLCPVRCQLFDLEERHLVNYGVAVSTGGREEAIDFSPRVAISEIMSETELALALAAPGLVPGANASPIAAPPGFRPEPVRTAFRTVLAFPRSSRFSTLSGVASG